ncbi:MAG: molybdopterin dinucleotide binding domain-containing protein [Acidobacteriota bacterium]
MKTGLIDRRNVLKFLGGSALGTVLSPLPWKVLDDVSIWTQNWSWIPVPPRGETVIRHTSCALCPAGCGVKARCVGAQPISLSGLPGHPTSRGFLCPGGLLGHHLPYSPGRVLQPLRRTAGAKEAARLSPEQAVADLAGILGRLKADPAAGRVAIIDSLPGRSVSLAYRRFAAQFAGGAYVAPSSDLKSSLRVFRGIGGQAYPEIGIDLERARTILSFGADWFEGWGTPGRLTGKRQPDQAARVTQIEPRYSHTAALADAWLPVRPGTEPILALGIASVILRDRLFNPALSPLVNRLNEIADFRDLSVAMRPERSAEICGIDAESVTRVAREIATRLPGLALAGGLFDADEIVAVNLLSLLTGAAGSEGVFVPRRSIPEVDTLPAAGLASPTEISQIPDESIALLIVDTSVLGQSFPSSAISRKLVPQNAAVVSFTSLATGFSDLSHYVLPVPMYLEAFEEIPTPADSPVASLSFSVPFLPAPPAACSPVEWVNRLVQAARLEWESVSVDALAEARIKAVWNSKRGSVYSYPDGASKATADFSSAEELVKAFRSGACWLDSPAEAAKPDFAGSPYLSADTWGRLKGSLNRPIEVSTRSDESSLTLMPFRTSILALGAASPLAGKLTRESDFYPRPGDALISPSTAAQLGLHEGQKAELETSKGRLAVRVRIDETAVPGVAFVPVCGTDDPRDLCDISEDFAWRPTPAKIRRFDV